MLRSYLTVAVRNLWRHRTYSVNSILSLAVSLAVCLLLVLLLYDQWQFDRYHEHADRIYRVVLNRDFGASASSPAPLGPALEQRHSGVVAATRVSTMTGHAVIDGASLSYEGLYTEPSYFALFDRPIRAGGSPEALAAPNQVFLSAAWAERAFGEANPVGQSLELDGIGTVTVAGVLDLPPGPTHLQGDIFLSFATVEAQQPPELDPWKDVFTYSHNYVLLAPGVHPEQLEAAFDDVRAAHFPDAEPGTFTFRLQSVTNIALGPELSNDPAQGILDRTALYFLGGLGLIVLVAASFTFTSLSLARALQRTKEVGVRKTIGAHRWHVAGQFLVEALVLAVLALTIAVAMLPSLVSLFNGHFLADTVGIHLAFHPLQEPGVLLLFLGVAICVGLVAGLYPAWALSAPQPVQVMRGRIAGVSRRLAVRSRVRRALLGVQLSLSFVLVVSTLVMYRQSAYELEADYGFDTDRLIQVYVQDASPEVLMQTARALSGVESVARIFPFPIFWGPNYTTVQSGERDLDLVEYYGDPGAVVSTLGIDLVAGTLPTGSAGIVINETAAHRLGVASAVQAVGTTLQRDSTAYTVRGVMQDVHLRALHAPIEPVGVFPAANRGLPHLLIRARPEQHQAILDQLDATWPDLDPVHAFDGATYEEALREYVAPFRDTMLLVGATGLFALLIMGFGLLGITAYATQSRTKEVGIRKALGATVTSVTTLLSKEFLVLTGAALVVALPVSWLLNRWWLSNYAYHVDIGVGVFLAAIALLLAVTLGTVGWQSWRVAQVPPAETLRDE